MATITFLGGPADMADTSFGTLFTDPNLSASASLREIGMSPASMNYVFAFSGAGFIYDGSGDFTGGTVTGFSGADSGVADFTIANLDLSAVSIQTLLNASDGAGLLALLTAGDDNITGTSGDDHLLGGGGFDFIFGGDANDTLEGGAADDFLTGGLGADSLDGGGGVDIANYGFSSAINIDLLLNSASGGDAQGDTLTGIESVIAASENDTLRGDGGDNYFNGAGGNDSIEGRGGADNVEAGGGNDTVDGGDGGDTLDGEDGADSLRGGANDDRLSGGASPDTIQGGLGADTLDGGTAFDTVDYTDKAGGVNVNVINGVALTGGFINSAGFYQGGAQEDVISNFENINGTEFADRLIAGSTSARIEGRGGNDYLFTFSGNDTIFGGAGNDFISTAKSSDMLHGEAGNDTLNGGTGLDTLDGGADRDTADYSDRTGAVSVNLGSGTAITGGMLNASGFYTGGFTEDSLVSIENIIGSAFGDRLVGSGAGSSIVGGGGGDSIASFSGADTITGGDGNDTITGGAGNDRFFFSVGHDADRITDFSAGAAVGDVIKFFGFGTALDSFAEVIAASAQVGADVVITLGGGDQITLAGVTLANLSANDFEFG
jgi:Ca2+-binding RTX toxin-like protein